MMPIFANLMSPDAAVGRLRRKIPSYIKWSFFSAIVLGLVAHLYMLANKLPNHDDIYHLFQCDYGALSGRWFLPTVLDWDGDFSMPWLIGVLSLLCLAGTVCVTASLFRIRTRLGCVLTAALLTAFPTVAATFSYMFTADAYFFGLLLAAFSAYAVARMPIMGVPLGAIAAILSLGIYQSYFPVAAVLMVGTLLFDCLEGERTMLNILLRGVKMVVTLGLGIVVYMAAARLATANAGGLSDYMGISSMGSISMSELPELIRKCYDTYREYFLENSVGWYFNFIHYLILAVFVCGLVLLLTLILRRRVGFGKGLLAIVLAACYPLAGNLIHIMVGGEAVHYLMIYGSVYILVLPVALTSFAAVHAEEMGSLRVNVQALLSWIILIAISLTAYNYIVTDNKAYLKMEISFDQIKAYSNRLVTAIQSVDGYSTDLPVVLYGASSADVLLDVTPEVDEIILTGVLEMGTYRTEYSYGEFLNRYMALPNDVYISGTLKEVDEAIGDVASWIPTYPQSGSVQIVNGYIVVRLN